MNILPFTIYAVNNYSWADSPELAKRIFLRDKKKVWPDKSWYAADLIVNSSEEIEIVVRDIESHFHGGIGKVIHRYKPVLDKKDLQELATIINRKQVEKATEVYYRRLEEQEEIRRNLEIEKVRQELFGN